jgi:hypothetical protein
VNKGEAVTCLGADERRAGQKKGHGVAAGICFECGSVAWGKKKRRRGACGRVHVKGEGGNERGPYHGGR